MRQLIKAFSLLVITSIMSLVYADSSDFFDDSPTSADSKNGFYDNAEPKTTPSFFDNTPKQPHDSDSALDNIEQVRYQKEIAKIAREQEASVKKMANECRCLLPGSICLTAVNLNRRDQELDNFRSAYSDRDWTNHGASEWNSLLEKRKENSRNLESKKRAVCEKWEADGKRSGGNFEEQLELLNIERASDARALQVEINNRRDKASLKKLGDEQVAKRAADNAQQDADWRDKMRRDEAEKKHQRFLNEVCRPLWAKGKSSCKCDATPESPPRNEKRNSCEQ